MSSYLPISFQRRLSVDQFNSRESKTEKSTSPVTRVDKFSAILAFASNAADILVAQAESGFSCVSKDEITINFHLLLDPTLKIFQIIRILCQLSAAANESTLAKYGRQKMEGLLMYSSSSRWTLEKYKDLYRVHRLQSFQSHKAFEILNEFSLHPCPPALNSLHFVGSAACVDVYLDFRIE